MRIDFEKLIKLILPTFLRTSLQNLIIPAASTFQNLYEDYQLWETDMRIQAAVTCQVIYLEMILNFRLLNTFTRTIYITDGDGVLVDFIVNVPSGVTVDANRLVGLIDKYKTCGKRYTIGQSSYTYEINWSGPVCEKSLLTYSSAWSDMVCEQTEQAPQTTNLISATAVDMMIRVNSQYPVTSDVVVTVQYVIAGVVHTVEVRISMGNDSAFSDSFGVPVTQIQAMGAAPEFDSMYRYITV